MKPSTINRVPVTAFCVQAGKPETDAEMAAPLCTDLTKHRAHRGSHKSADGSQVNRWWGPGADDSPSRGNVPPPMSNICAVDRLEFAAGQAAGGQPPDPRDLSLWYQSRGLFSTSETGCRAEHPASVLVPESALGLLPSIALSSAQAGTIVIVGGVPPKRESMEDNEGARMPARLRRSPPSRA